MTVLQEYARKCEPSKLLKIESDLMDEAQTLQKRWRGGDARGGGD